MMIHPRISISFAFMAMVATLSQGCFGLRDRGDAASEDGDVANPVDVPSEAMDVPSAVVDVPNAAVDSGVCSMGTVVCGMSGCVNLQSNALHCRACGMACPSRANGTPICAAGVCSIGCNAGFTELFGECIADPAFPRPILPLSLGDVSLRRPTLRWQLPARGDGAVVDLCRDRACSMVIESLRVVGTSARPTTPLPANTVVFWRLRATLGMATSAIFSPTWLFHVPARDNNNNIDTSSNPHLDVNGDGFDDVVVGAWAASPGGRMNAGTASIFLGSGSGVAQMPSRVFEGSIAGDRFGQSVASAGDVNGDGFGDLVIGAHQADPRGRLQAGAASIFHGSAGGLPLAPTRVLEGSATGDLFGVSVSSAGDVNGDGFGDLVIGATYADPGGRMNAGAASVFHGSARGISMVPASLLEGTIAGDSFGFRATTAGDVNGDGFSDLVIGAPDADRGGRVNAGVASIFHGSGSGILMVASRNFETAAAGDSFGFSVADAGDVNGDGFADVVVGAHLADGAVVLDAGTASIFHGSILGTLMAPAIVLAGPAFADYFGKSVSSAGDVNGDGYSDLVIGAFGADPQGRVGAGTASVFHGSAMGVSMLPTRVLEGLVASDAFGWSVATADKTLRDPRNNATANHWFAQWLRRFDQRV